MSPVNKDRLKDIEGQIKTLATERDFIRSVEDKKASFELIGRTFRSENTRLVHGDEDLGIKDKRLKWSVYTEILYIKPGGSLHLFEFQTQKPNGEIFIRPNQTGCVHDFDLGNGLYTEISTGHFKQAYITLINKVVGIQP